jgi:phosphopantetheine--protein transferase-like protein
MIGNDIVDLKLAEKQSSWRRKGFLEKVFSANEQAMIFEAEKPDLIVWRLWSMKESAYKARLRVQKQIQINPKDFDCEIVNDQKGMVHCGSKMYRTRSEINDDFVHTQAFSKEFDHSLFSKVIAIDQSRSGSKQLYNAAILSVVTSANPEESDVVIRKNSLGIPELYKMGKKMPFLCSLSHHGRYGSYVISDYQKNQNGVSPCKPLTL